MSFSITVTARSQLSGAPTDGNSVGTTTFGGANVSFTLTSNTSFDSLQAGVTQVQPNTLAGTWTFWGYLDVGGSDFIVLQQNTGPALTYFTFGLWKATTGTFHAAALSSGSDYACYLHGTRIMTDRGPIEIQHLQAGDRVVTRSGALRPITWIGRQRYSGQFTCTQAAPVRFSRGSLGGDVPARDLWVSPAHAMLIDNHLVAASLLVNDMTITQERTGRLIEYYHLDLGAHDCVLAEGAWSESYWENAGNRSHFDNAAGFRAAGPPDAAHGQPCLPYLHQECDPRLPALRAALTPRLTPDRLSPDPDFHITADGRRLDTLKAGEDTWQVAIPRDLHSLRLRSRATRPSMVSGSHDHRALGICLSAIWLDGRDGRKTIPLDHPALGLGFHAPESAGEQRWRWTDGDAVVPIGLFVDVAEPTVLTVRGHHQPINLMPAIC